MKHSRKAKQDHLRRQRTLRLRREAWERIDAAAAAARRAPLEYLRMRLEDEYLNETSLPAA